MTKGGRFMSDFDRENEDFFQEIHRNHRRSNATQVVGYIVPQKEAQELAVKRAVGNRADGIGSLILLAAQLFVLVSVTVLALA